LCFSCVSPPIPLGFLQSTPRLKKKKKKDSKIAENLWLYSRKNWQHCFSSSKDEIELGLGERQRGGRRASLTVQTKSKRRKVPRVGGEEQE